MQHVPPLCLVQTVLLPGTETAWRSEYWSFARVCGGVGYLSSGAQTRPLAADDFILVPAGASVRLRASQLSTLGLCHFELRPAEVPGVFSLPEERFLALAGREGHVAPQVLPAGSPIARQFAGLCTTREREPALILRSEMVRLAAHALRDIVQPPRTQDAGAAKDRFRKLLSHASTAEFMSQGTCELARRCGCSQRHFRRLFKAELGLSLRAWQVQARIHKAARLLRESDTKVIDVALESGFQHLGQFNATFKRLFGKTPSAWRQARARRSRPFLCLRSRGQPLSGTKRGPEQSGREETGIPN